MSSQQRVKSANGTSRPGSRGHVRPGSRGAVSIGNHANANKESVNMNQRKVVGQYMLGKTIGEGTFGKVKLAIHLPTGEKVAVKILEKNRIKEQADVRRVNREIKILKKSRHENIIQLYEVLDTQNSIYLIMENCSGGEMFDYIVAARHVPEPQACKFFHQIIDGIEVLHNNEITHRDLKPENLLLKHTNDGILVKIVDFGLSNTHEGGKLLSTACGSPCYAAPEMIAGKQYFGPLADLWSSGVILFALVCGFLPFEDPNTSALYRKILAGDYKPPKWISPEVRDLIRHILETDPAKRYTIADIRKHPWYCKISNSQLPHDVVSDVDKENIHNETIQAINEAGYDAQVVMDGVISHACNSMTSMYHLLIQKYRNALTSNTPITSNNGQSVLKPNPSQTKPIQIVSNDQPTATLNDTNNEINQQNKELEQLKIQQQTSQDNRPKSRGGTSSNSRNNIPDPRIVASQQQQKLSIQQQQYSNAQNNSQPNDLLNIPCSTSNAQPQRVIPTHRLVSPYVQAQQVLNPPANGNVGISLDKYLENGMGPLGIVGSNNPNQNPKPTSRGGSRIRTGGGSKKPPITPLIVGQPQHLQQAQLLQQNGIVVPKLNLFPQTNVVNKYILVSQTSRNVERPKSSSGSHSARASIPNRSENLNKNINLNSNIDDDFAIPVPVDILGPMPDGDTERPTTRRSKLRSRGEGETSNQDEDGSGLIPSAPTEIINQVQSISLNAQAPENIPRSTHSSGGRRGKHINGSNEQSQGLSNDSKNINNTINNNYPPPSMFNQLIAPQSPRKNDVNTIQLQSIHSLNSPREAALKNKNAAQGSLGLSFQNNASKIY